jgi:hypothetical protein
MKKIEENINIFFLPLDDRPCSYKYISEFFYILFNQKKLKNINFFWDFDFFKLVSKNATDFSNSLHNNNFLPNNLNIYILSLDAFLFTNLVKSRFIDSYHKYHLKINELIDFIKTNKNSFFYLYISIPRIILNLPKNSKENINENQVDHDKLIELNFRLSHKLKNTFKKYQYGKFNQILKKLNRLIQEFNLDEKYYKILKTFLITRKNKFNLIKFLLNKLYSLKVENGLSNFELIISLDDSQKKALNFLELDFFRYYLKKYLKNIIDRVYFFVGLDEIHLILFAKALLNIFNTKKLELYLLFNNKINRKFGRYEGTSLKNILKIYNNFFKEYVNFNFIQDIKTDKQFKKLNLNIDLSDVLFINLFNKKYQYESVNQVLDILNKMSTKFKQKESKISFENFLNYSLLYFKRYFNRQNDSILYSLKYICDVEYSNGASLKLIFFYLFNYQIFKKLNLYFSWNTLGNTLGSSISFFILYKLFNLKETKELKEFVLNNFLEGIYQSIIRYFAKKYNWDIIKIKDSFLYIFKNFNIEDIDIEYINLPWNRYFEIDIKTKYNKK